MKLVVVIATLGRRVQVARLLRLLDEQCRPPDAVILSATGPSHVEIPEGLSFPVRTLFGAPGSCVQRNVALDAALSDFDIVTFFDDDFVPARDYLTKMLAAFEANPDFAVVMGRVILDGATNAGIAWENALAALAQAEDGEASAAVIDHVGAYGCNMSVRASMVGDLRFDERLVLYGWQEDIDFSCRLRDRGRVVCVSTLRGVHLGLKIGRVSGTRFGYSQVVNPIYLIRKGSVPAGFALPLMLRNVAANIVRSVRPEPYVDRRGRLRGNLLGIAHLLRGRIEPEHAKNLT